MSSSDLNLPDLAQGGAVAQPRNNTPADTSEDMRERIAADLRPVFDVPVSVQAVIGRTTIWRKLTVAGRFWPPLACS